MKKCYMLSILLLVSFFLAGCMGAMSPSEKVEDLFNKYIKNDQEIMLELDDYIAKQDLTDDQKTRYKNVIKDEYANIKYKITDEEIDDKAAVVEVTIDVKDLYKANENAENYLINNPTAFYNTAGTYDQTSFIDYKLGVMEQNVETITYTIYINLIRENNEWKIEDMDKETLEKIHGIYNYETA